MDSAARILPAHIEDTVRAIAELHAEHHRQATAAERLFDRSVRFVARPRFVALLTAAILLWMVGNAILGAAGLIADKPPYQILQDLGEALGLYLTVLILITQRREDEIAQHREQLTLELAIISEQKSAKIIQLLEEMRRDNPLIKNRVDHEANALSVPADPQAVLDAIKDTHEEMIASVTDETG